MSSLLPLPFLSALDNVSAGSRDAPGGDAAQVDVQGAVAPLLDAPAPEAPAQAEEPLSR